MNREKDIARDTLLGITGPHTVLPFTLTCLNLHVDPPPDTRVRRPLGKIIAETSLDPQIIPLSLR